MQRVIVLLALLLAVVVGCASNMSEVADGFRSANRRNLNRLSIGMPIDSMKLVMGENTVKGKQWNGLVNGGYEYEEYVNPHRVETMIGRDGTYLVYFYYTDMKAADGAITDDELTPIVVKDNHVLGWGWMYFEDAVKTYEIRMR